MTSLLTEYQAELLTQQAVSAASELASLLTRLHDGEAWRALGYPSWTAYVNDKFDVSLRTIQRYIKQERAREALTGHDSLSRFTGEALEALATIDDDHIRAVADIAAASQTGRIGIQTVRSVLDAVTELLNTGAATDEHGNQHLVSDVMAAGVEAYERERVNASREYIVANIEAQLKAVGWYGCTLKLTVDKSDIERMNNILNEPIRITIWRDPK